MGRRAQFFQIVYVGPFDSVNQRASKMWTFLSQSIDGVRNQGL